MHHVQIFKLFSMVDVAVKKGNYSIAIEIETGELDFIKNILKNLKAGFDFAVSVATSYLVENRIREKLRDKKMDRIKRVKITTVRASE
ncbi:MAG: hypothetical protein ABIL05_02525 [candidate division WOR-3 bacterium]